ncbi:YjbQ family protein [Streptomyces longwoodensis]
MSDAFTTHVLTVPSGSREAVVDLTRDCESFLREAAAGRDGLLNVFVPHATAGVAVIETGAGSDDDLLAALHTLLPADDRWQHRHGSPGHGRDHVLPAFVAPHATLPVVGGRLELGTWQSVCLVDTNRDNPERTVRLSFLAG